MKKFLGSFPFSKEKDVPRIVVGILVVIFLMIPVFTNHVVLLTTLILTGIWAVAAMGFILVLRTGQFSLGQAAFMAIGGYTSAIMTIHLNVSFWFSFLISGLVSGVIALLVGMVVLRVGGIYFSIITLALGEIVRIIALQWEPLTNGSRGIITSAPPPIVFSGNELINFDATQVPYFYFMVILVAVTGVIYYRIGASRLGRMFAGVLFNPTLAEHQGIYLMKYRVIAFTVAGIFTGYAGALYTHFLTVITPLVFGFGQSVQIMITGIVGGLSSLVAGPILGSIMLYNLGTNLARFETPGLQSFLFGAVMLLVIIFLPQGSGLVDLWKMIWERVWRKREPVPVEIDRPAQTTQNIHE